MTKLLAKCPEIKKNYNVIYGVMENKEKTVSVRLEVTKNFYELSKKVQETPEMETLKALFIQGARIMQKYGELKKEGWTLEFVSPDRSKSIQVML